MAKGTPGGELPFPKGETVWVQYHEKTGELHHIMTTKKGDRNTYYLYVLENGAWKRLGRGKSPVDLENKYMGCL